jgi:DNA-binding PadR family transcriptional regulator
MALRVVQAHARVLAIKFLCGIRLPRARVRVQEKSLCESRAGENNSAIDRRAATRVAWIAVGARQRLVSCLWRVSTANAEWFGTIFPIPSGVLPPLIIGEREIDMFVKGGALYEQLGLFRQMKCGSAEIWAPGRRRRAEFFVLGALHRADLHPYEIKRRLNNALVQCYTDVDVGTLYYAVRQLARSGDIVSRCSEKVTRGGERTVYRITPKGKKRFQELLLERFREEGSVAQTIYPTLLFLHLAPLPTVAKLLRQRLQEIESDLAKVHAMKDQLGPVLGTGSLYLLDHLIEIRQLDRRWLRRLLTDVEAGKVRDLKPTAIKRLAQWAARAKWRR